VSAPRAKRGRHCRFCGSADHDARNCTLPYCGGITDGEPCAVEACRVHRPNERTGVPRTEAAPPAPAADDEDPEPADDDGKDFVYPKSETLKVQARENKRGRSLAIVYDRPAIVGSDLRAGITGTCTNEVRPCPWQGCRHHLAIWDVNPESGTIRYTHPGKTLGQLQETCVLDVVKANPDGATLEKVGELVGLTRERVRQIEVMALAASEDVVPASAA